MVYGREERASKIHPLKTPRADLESWNVLGVFLFPRTYKTLARWDAITHRARGDVSSFPARSYLFISLGLERERIYSCGFRHYFLWTGKYKSNTPSILSMKKNLSDWKPCRGGKSGGREEHCFFSPKCFHSLNKFNKTSFDWQESALPQCLLFALTFLVSSCAPFLNETEAANLHCTHTLSHTHSHTHSHSHTPHTHTHSHTLSTRNKWDFYASLRGPWMCYSWQLSEALFLCHWEFGELRPVYSARCSHISAVVILVFFIYIFWSQNCCKYLNQSVADSFKFMWAEVTLAQEVMHFTFPVAAACLQCIIQTRNLWARTVAANGTSRTNVNLRRRIKQLLPVAQQIGSVASCGVQLWWTLACDTFALAWLCP